MRKSDDEKIKVEFMKIKLFQQEIVNFTKFFSAFLLFLVSPFFHDSYFNLLYYKLEKAEKIEDIENKEKRAKLKVLSACCKKFDVVLTEGVEGDESEAV